MNKYITLSFSPLNLRIRAKLLEELNPKLCEIVKNKLPYKSIQCHALVAGEQLYHYTPIIEAVTYKAKIREDKIKQPVGRINMSSLELLSIKYGKITEYLTSVPVAQVVQEDIQKLVKVGRLVWESIFETKKLITATVSLENQKIPSNLIGLNKPDFKSSNKKIDNLVKKIYKECEKIWLSPPKEIIDIHNGFIKSQAGSYNQYFSTMIFVNGELRQIGYNAFGGILKVLTSKNISLMQAKEIPKPFTEIAAGFLGYCGLEKLDNFSQKALKLIKEARSKKEIIEIYRALCMYANRLHGWSLHYFPWKLGQKYKLKFT